MKIGYCTIIADDLLNRSSTRTYAKINNGDRLVSFLNLGETINATKDYTELQEMHNKLLRKQLALVNRIFIIFVIEHT